LPTRKVLDHLEPLAHAGRDLPAEALRYVEHGDGSYVLAKLAGANLQQAWRRKHNSYPVRDKGDSSPTPCCGSPIRCADWARLLLSSIPSPGITAISEPKVPRLVAPYRLGLCGGV
jgi:hypothetical protein